MDFSQNQEALYGKMAQSGAFAQLEQIVQERNNAVINHKKKDNTNAYTLSKASEALANFARNAADAKGKLGARAPRSKDPGSSSPGVGSGNPGVGAGASQGPSPQPPTDNGSGTTPNNWPDFGNASENGYDMAMYNYFMESMSSGMNNPNSIIYFIEALAKMMSSGNPEEQAHLAAFTKALCGATTTDPITGKGSMSYAKAIAMMLEVVDAYDKAKGTNSDFIGQLRAQLGAGGSNPFIAQILSALNGSTQAQVAAEIQSTYGVSLANVNQTILSFITESLALNSKGLDTAGAAYKSSYIQMLRQRYIQQEFRSMESKGANALEMMQFLLGAVCGGIDDKISSYSVSIGALSDPGEAIGNLKGDLSPNSTNYDNPADAQKAAQAMEKLVKQLELDTHNPILQQNGIAKSIQDFLDKVDKVADGSITFGDVLSGKTTAAQTQAFFKWLMAPQKQGNSQKMNPALQDLVNEIGIPEQQISSQNDMEKTLFTNANQQGSQNISAAGGIIKDLMKLFSLTVQNQKS